MLYRPQQRIEVTSCDRLVLKGQQLDLCTTSAAARKVGPNHTVCSFPMAMLVGFVLGFRVAKSRYLNVAE